jgi:hypothetical protein
LSIFERRKGDIFQGLEKESGFFPRIGSRCGIFSQASGKPRRFIPSLG